MLIVERNQRTMQRYLIKSLIFVGHAFCIKLCLRAYLQREKQMKANQRLQEESDDEDEGNEDEHEETLCGSCGTNGNEDEFWIGCDICEKWYHGKCVKITPAKAQSIKEYRCPSCSNKRAKHMA